MCTWNSRATLKQQQPLQINYSIRLIKPVIDHKARSFEVLESACDRYNGDIQRRMGETIFTDCSSWYRAANTSGKNIAMFPGPITLFWWWSLWTRWDDYIAIGAERWLSEGTTWKYFKVYAVPLVLSVAFSVFWLS